jgi:hypothetical protein
MRRTILFTASMMVFTFASGEGLTLADVKATSAVQLSADDLKQLLPGAKVVNQIPFGKHASLAEQSGRGPYRVERRARQRDDTRLLRLRYVERRRQRGVLRAHPMAHADRRVVPLRLQSG